MSELLIGQLRGLPVNNNIVTVPSGHTLYAPGHVIQVVQSSTSTMVSNTSTTYVDTGLSATITPKFATSKIFVVINQHVFKGVTATENAVNLRILRGATQIFQAGSLLRTASTVEINSYQPLQILDSPNTTSAITYKTTVANNTAANQVQVQNNSNPSYITLMEIAQ
jgi:hypothetical protein